MSKHLYLLKQPTVLTKEQLRLTHIRKAKYFMSFARKYRLEGSPIYYEILDCVAARRLQALALL